MNEIQSPALALFAKQPIPGKVKSRLARQVGNEAAAGIAIILLQLTVARCRASWDGPLYLFGWPSGQCSLFQELAERWSLVLANQSPGGLGRKMKSALAELVDTHGAAAVMGADIPHCPATVLEETRALLKKGEGVIGPANDGGYYLIGIAGSVPCLFDDMPWGTSRVFQQTRLAANRAGLPMHELTRLQDIDEWEDLQLVMEHDEDLARAVRALLKNH